MSFSNQAIYSLESLPEKSIYSFVIGDALLDNCATNKAAMRLISFNLGERIKHNNVFSSHLRGRTRFEHRPRIGWSSAESLTGASRVRRRRSGCRRRNDPLRGGSTRGQGRSRPRQMGSCFVWSTYARVGRYEKRKKIRTKWRLLQFRINERFQFL